MFVGRRAAGCAETVTASATAMRTSAILRAPSPEPRITATSPFSEPDAPTVRLMQETGRRWQCSHSHQYEGTAGSRLLPAVRLCAQCRQELRKECRTTIHRRL